MGSLVGTGLGHMWDRVSDRGSEIVRPGVVPGGRLFDRSNKNNTTINYIEHVDLIICFNNIKSTVIQLLLDRVSDWE